MFQSRCAQFISKSLFIQILRKFSALLIFVIAFTAHAALDPAGDLDTTFNTTGFNSTNFALVNTFAESRGVGIQQVGANAGKIVLGGSFQDGFNTHFALLRINPDGTQDFGFGVGGEVKTVVGGNDLINDIGIQGDDKIIAAGFVDNDFAIARYTADGVLDTTFGGGDGIVIAGLVSGEFDRGHGVAVQPDGKILISGTSFTNAANNRDVAVLRLNANGSIDTSFGGGDGFATLSMASTGTERGFDIALQPDGKIVVSGNTPTGSSTCNTFPYTDQNSFVARFNSNGTLDTSFDGDGFRVLSLGTGNCPDDNFHAVTLQADGKIVAAGAAVTTHDGSTNPKFNISVARFNTDGSLDSTFSGDGLQFNNIAPTSTFLTDQAEDVRIQSDGKIVVGAFSDSFVGGGLTAANFAVLRYNPDGTLDNTYDGDGIRIIDFGDSDNLDALTLDSDGRVIAVGYRSVAGQVLPDIYIAAARLTTAGVPDTTFAGTGSFFKQLQGGSVEQGYGIGVQSTGKPVVVGYTTTNTSTDFAVIRYNTDGTLDTTFDGDGKASADNGNRNDTGRAVAIQPDNKIVVVGDSFGTTGASFFTVLRFHANGALDTAFDGDGFASFQVAANANVAHAVALQSDDKIVAAGAVSQSSSSWDFAVARFHSNGTLDTSFDTDGIFTLSLVAGIDEARAVAIQPDGKILVGGYAFPNTSQQRLALIRLNPNGSLDNTFDGDGIVITPFGSGAFPRSEIRSLAVLPDGKIVGGGKCNDGGNNSNNLFCVVRYNPNGSLDTTFSGDGIATTNIESDRFDEAFAIAVQHDEKIVAFGSSLKLFVTNNDFALVRYNWDDGSLDTTFGPTNAGFAVTQVSSSGDLATGGKILPGGTLVAGGTGNGSDLAAARYLNDPPAITPGTPDLNAASDSGASSTDNLTNITTPVFNGSCNIGETVILKVNGATSAPLARHLCRTGTYSVTSNPLVPDGTYSISAFSRNANNDSVDSSSISVTIDTIALPPTITFPEDGVDYEFPPSPTITGTGAEPGATVLVAEGLNPVCSGIADASGNWSCASSLTVGSHTIVARQTDLAGNTSAPSASVTFSLTQRADLAITKTDGVPTAIPGLGITYTITVTNIGPSDAPGSIVTDTFPAGLINVTWTCSATSGSCSASGAGNINDTVDIPVGAVLTYIVNATIDPSATGTLSNTAAVATSASIVDPEPTNNSANDTTDLIPETDLAIVKSDLTDPVDAASTVTYILSVANNGPSTATTVSVSDTLPPGVTFLGASGAGWTCIEAGGNVTCTRPDIVPGAAPDITITVTAPSEGGSLLNSASVTNAVPDTDSNNNSDNENTSITAVADLSVTKIDSQDPVDAEAAYSYTVSVNNAGPSTATSVSVEDTLPAGASFVSASGTGWSCNESAGIVACTRADLAPGAADDITINVLAPAQAGTATNTVIVSAAEADPDPSNNNDSEDTTISAVADLSVTKSDSPDPVRPEQNLTYTITLTNNGPSDADDVTVTDQTPPLTTFVSASLVSGSGWNISDPGTGNTGAVVFSKSAVSASETATFEIVVLVDAGVANGTLITNTVTADTTTNDPDNSNNSDSEDTTVNVGPGEIEFSAAAYSVAENAGPAVITLTRTGGVGEVSVSFATSDGTATDPDDYNATSVVVTWADGDTSPKTVNVPVLDDLEIEGDEDVNLTLSNPTGGATLGAQSTAVLTIADDEPPSPGSVQLENGVYNFGEAVGNAQVVVTRINGTLGEVSVTLSTSDGTALQPDDYTATAVTITFADGDKAPKIVDIPIIDDILSEKKETLQVALSDATNGVVIGAPASATLNIQDNDSPCLFCDDFEDGVLAPSRDWSYSKGVWNEAGGSLIGTNFDRKTLAIANPIFTGCLTCAIDTTMQTAGGAFGRVSLFGWWNDKRNNVELVMDAERGRWILKQRIGGKIVKKKKLNATIVPGQVYTVRLSFNGFRYELTIDGQSVMTMLVETGQNGSVGYRVKRTSGTFGFIEVR